MSTADDDYRFFFLHGTANTSGVQSVVEVLWDTVRRLDEAGTADEALLAAAQAIARAGLYERSVLTLHNEQGDIIALGHYGLPEEVVAAARCARRVPAAKRQAVLDSANQISRSYFIPAELDIGLSGEGRYIKSERHAQGDGAWQPEDQLFVPIRDPRGAVIGYASVDTPVDGRRPDVLTVRHLELVVALAEKALARVRDGEGSGGLTARLQRLITSAGDIVFYVDLTTRALTYINPAVEELVGYPVEFILAQPIEKLWKMFVPPEDRKALWPKWSGGKQQIAEDLRQQADVDFQIRRRDGTLRWVRGMRTIVYDRERQAVAIEGILRDVTDQTATQRRLTELEQQYHNLARNAADLVYLRDTNGRLSNVSDAARFLWRIAPEEAVGTLFTDWLVDTPVNRGAFEVANTAIMQGKNIPPIP
jgi:PAS domain S-box-containing protein